MSPIPPKLVQKGDLSLGMIAIQILNYVLRPLLTKWHPLLLDYEQAKTTATTTLEHEQHWARAAELRQALREAQTILRHYARILEQVAEIPHYPEHY